MATAARKLSVAASGLSGVHNTSLKVVYANAAAGDITQLSTNKVLLVVDADATTAAAKNLILSQAEAAVAELRERLGAVSAPSQLGSATVTTYHSR